VALVKITKALSRRVASASYTDINLSSLTSNEFDSLVSWCVQSLISLSRTNTYTSTSTKTIESLHPYRSNEGKIASHILIF